LKNEDDAEFLKTAPNTDWQQLFENFKGETEEFETQARDADVPFAAVVVPNRAQAAMISSNSWPLGYDPYKLDNELRTVIVKNGGTFIDILPDFRGIPDAAQYYLAVDGHLNVKGQALVSEMLAKELTCGAVPALRSFISTQNTAERTP
jgi:hypothetical protein